MTEKIVELIRRFAPMSSLSSKWDFFMSGPGHSQRWNEIEDEFRVLIIADPGAGKTFEAQASALKIKARNRHAFFIRIEKIDANFDQAFEVGTAAEFASWLDSTDEAWFFLDSVDEAQLETPRALEHAVRIFGAKIHGALARARIHHQPRGCLESVARSDTDRAASAVWRAGTDRKRREYEPKKRPNAQAVPACGVIGRRGRAIRQPLWRQRCLRFCRCHQACQPA